METAEDSSVTFFSLRIYIYVCVKEPVGINTIHWFWSGKAVKGDEA